MRFYKILIHFVVFVLVLITIYVFQTDNRLRYRTSNFIRGFGNHTLSKRNEEQDILASLNSSATFNKNSIPNVDKNYNVWCIFTKVKHIRSPLKYKFERFVKSLLKYSSVVITLHVISDKNSQVIAESVIKDVRYSNRNKQIKSIYHNVQQITNAMTNLTAVMQPAFSPQRGGYYSDALFYISMDLHSLDPFQDEAVMIDIDTELEADILLLFQQFDNFKDSELLGLAPELSPVYQHVLYLYRSRHKNTKFGSPISKGGFPGLNSGGHLGDQDMYTLMKMEYPELIHVLPCEWNRQLCKWWRDHGYPDVFDSFAECKEPIKLYHGNCNTPIPFRN